MDAARLLLVLAWRNLLAHRVKSFFVGLLLFVGTFLFVLGSAITRSVERTMEEALTGSVAGHLQVYDADAEDTLTLFGQEFEPGDFGEIPRFEDVDRALRAVDGVREVVPMAITGTTVFGSNDIDRVLVALRAAVTAGDREAIDAMVGRARRIVDGLAADSEARAAIDDPEIAADQNRRLARASDPAFWDAFRPEAPTADALLALDWLDSQIAPLASDGRLHYLTVLGTDPALYAASFEKFYIADGANIEPGQRGFLFSKRTYEELIKHPVARALDSVLDDVEDGARIADDEVLALRVTRNARQYKRIVYQLAPARADALRDELRDLLGLPGAELDALLQAFLTVTDDTVRERHAWFYAHIAPHIELYDIPVGGTITLRSFTRSGYLRAVNVPVLGTYELQGLEEAGLMSASNLTDLATFRSLYGKMTDADREELATIKAEVGAREVGRDDAEAMLFGGASLVEAAAAAAPAEVPELVVDRQAADARYDPATLRQGLVVNAAILLDDPDRLAASRAAIEAAIAREGLRLQVVDWQGASGMIGQFILVMRVVLALGLFLIFLVALILINNAMVMATMDRVAEIGTMRAIGAQRTVVVGLFVLETVALGLLAGGAGALAATAVVGALGRVGIPAVGDILVLLFAGPRLFPQVGAFDLLFGMLVVTGVAFVSTLYPALVASRIEPMVAMQGKE